MPVFELILEDPKTEFSCNLNVYSWFLSFSARVEKEIIELTTGGGKLQDNKLKVTFESLSIPAYNKFDHGFFMYSEKLNKYVNPFDTRYEIWLRMSEGDLQRFMDIVIAGVKRVRVILGVNGMEYGGSGIIWDNASDPCVEIDGYDIILDH